MQNRIDASLSASTRDEILDLISQIRTKLPFTTDLLHGERISLVKMGESGTIRDITRKMGFMRNCSA